MTVQTKSLGSRPQTRQEKLDLLKEMFDLHGSRTYAEEVSQLEHMLQCAYFAERRRAPEHVVLAALFHDVGHFLDERGEFIADEGIDTRHERKAAAFLRGFFNRRIVGPVALHVAAKRYLAAFEPGYLERLSAASLKSLHLQGGPFTPAQAASFRNSPYFDDAILLRYCDEEGKQAGLTVPPLDHYDAMVLRHLKEE